MSTIKLDILGGDHGCHAGHARTWKDKDESMVIVPDFNLTEHVLVLKKQDAMAFFNLVPRMEHEGTNPDCDCGQSTCHNHEN